MDRPFCVAGIQARMSSSRLPGKVMAEISGRTMIYWIYQRTVLACLQGTYVLTSTERSDDELVEYLELMQIPHRRGDLGNVLSRYMELVDELEPFYVARICGDCPLIDPEFIEEQVRQLYAARASGRKADFLVPPRGKVWPLALAGQRVVSADFLRAALSSDDPRDREHVGEYFLAKSQEKFATVEFSESSYKLPETGDVTLSVDVAEELEQARRIYSGFPSKYGFSLRDALRLPVAHPG